MSQPNAPFYASEAPADAPATAPRHPAEDGPVDGPVVCRCGAPAHREDDGFCARHHPLPGHGGKLSLRHGLYQALTTAIAEERQAWLAQSLTDDGGEAEVPTRRRSLHEYRARLHVHICQLSDAIERHGLFDRRGRLRVSWLQRVEGLIATAQRIDGTLGLARHAKPALTPQEYWRQRVAERETETP